MKSVKFRHRQEEGKFVFLYYTDRHGLRASWKRTRQVRVSLLHRHELRASWNRTRQARVSLLHRHTWAEDILEKNKASTCFFTTQTYMGWGHLGEEQGKCVFLFKQTYMCWGPLGIEQGKHVFLYYTDRHGLRASCKRTRQVRISF